jgi:hypothetical protein
MTKTENFQFNQWDAADPIRRQDFNRDNAILDAALEGLGDKLEELAADLANQSRFTKLREVNVTADANSVEISLSGVDWSRWDKVHLDLLATNGSQMGLYFNNTETSRFSVSGSYSGGAYVYLPRISFFPGFRANRNLCAVQGATAVYPGYPYSSLSRLIIYHSSTKMPAGAKMILWGET